MAADYKNRAKPRQKNKPSSPTWAWFLTGFILGAFTVGLVWMGSSTEPESQWIDKATPATTKIEPPPDEEDQAVTPPTFDFYDLLPAMEIIIPADELNTQPLSTRKEKKKSEVSHYLLQVGSFKILADAEKLKASLALLGFQAKIKNSKSGTQTWHRVRIGPFASSKKLKVAQRLLTRNGHDSLTIKIK